MLVLHACWSGSSLAIWAEQAPSVQQHGADHAAPTAPEPAPLHPQAAHPDQLAQAILTGLGQMVPLGSSGSLVIRLPTSSGRPLPSPSLAHAVGHSAHESDLDSDEGDATFASDAEMNHAAEPAWAGSGPPGAELPEPEHAPLAHDLHTHESLVALRDWAVPALRLGPLDAARLLDVLDDPERAGPGETGLFISDSVRYYAAAARFARSLLAEQRVVPSLEPDAHGLSGVWKPWLEDEATSKRLTTLLSCMPGSARAASDAFAHDARAITEDFITAVVDRSGRAALVREAMSEALDGWEGGTDPHVSWLGVLLSDQSHVSVDDQRRASMLKHVRRWLSNLEERGTDSAWRLCLRLNEPISLGPLRDLEPPGESVTWTISFHLQAAEYETLIIDAEDIWGLRGESSSVQGRRIEHPQDLLLKELGRASRIYRRLESALTEQEPEALEVNTVQAYEFLREIRPLLAEQGFGVIVPEWWESPAARVGARLRLDSPNTPEGVPAGTTAPGATAQAMLGLQALVGYEWQIAVGDTPLSLDEFQKLAAKRAPLVRIGGRWVEVRPEDVQAAIGFIRDNPGGLMSVADALRFAYRSDVSQTGVPILGLDATGWVASLLEGSSGSKTMPTLETPEGFHGNLRPYQSRGLSWLSFLDALGLGPCLADDMGLGKTVQLLALMVHEQNQADALGQTRSVDYIPGAAPSGTGPTLLVVPMSIVANWKREADRFAPSLAVLVHHGVERITGEAFFHAAMRSDLVITTYALVHRDRAFLSLVPWRRVVLDEAQNIKNPFAKQSQAVRELDAPRRVALTGTPLENRLAELWSIMDFCNPGFLGTLNEFRRTFSVPIERYRDKERANKLRALVRPFILRRLKTDPLVITDLPSKLESKEFCRLTAEQASLYENCVKDMLTQVDRAEGIRRRGLVLTALIRLKQICNHPAQLPRDDDPDAGGSPQPVRSGKCIRLLELLEEVIASNAQALVFTQFRQMGVLLASMLRTRFDREILLLHGGTPQGQRQAMIDRFQTCTPDAPPVLVLSLKAGGVGLNLTAATHVFHFDRWWNPAVENQATDRAFRIGQTKAVNVHKFVVSGTLEERIDQMIESKIALAQDVIGSGEDWLTELSTSQLRDILTLRPDAVADED